MLLKNKTIKLFMLIGMLVISGFYLENAYAETNTTLATSPAQKVYGDASKSVYTIYSVDEEKNRKNLGTAIAIDKHRLATNCHIALAGSFTVVEVNDKSYLGKLYYNKRDKDFCIIEITGATLNPVQIRPSQNVNIGEDVYAIGNPEGRTKTISRGIISNKLSRDGMQMLQTDAAISEGSSGGGLFDQNSHLIGITTSGDAIGERIGYAIPSELIIEAMKDSNLQKLQAAELTPTTEANAISLSKTSSIPQKTTPPSAQPASP